MRSAFSLAWDLVKAELQLPPGIRSFHGTNTRALERIMEEGIQPQPVNPGDKHPIYDKLGTFNAFAPEDIRDTRVVWSSPHRGVAENYAIRSVMNRLERPNMAIREPPESWRLAPDGKGGRPTILGISEDAPWFPDNHGIRELGREWGTFHMNPPIPPQFLIPIPDEEIDWLRWMTRGMDRLPEHLRERAVNRRREILQSLGWPV